MITAVLGFPLLATCFQSVISLLSSPNHWICPRTGSLLLHRCWVEVCIWREIHRPPVCVQGATHPWTTTSSYYYLIHAHTFVSVWYADDLNSPQVMPVLLFLSAIVSVLYYIGFMPWLICKVRRLNKLRGGEQYFSLKQPLTAMVSVYMFNCIQTCIYFPYSSPSL